jgi:hypothetical protein
MSLETTVLSLEIGATRFSATLRRDLAPHACECLISMLPYRGTVIHARWSGEALWSPLGDAWPGGRRLAPENATYEPKAGQVLLYAGEVSEPELLIPYGTARFASKAGPLAGNPVLTIDDPAAALARLGPGILWKGAAEFKIDWMRQYSP